MTPRVRRLATVASSALAALSLAACGDSLVDHRNLKIRDQVQGVACQSADQLVCDVAGVPTCKSQGVGPDKVCGSACQPCLEPGPANSTRVCSPTPDGTDRFCDFTCAPGFLKTATACEAPKLVAAGSQFACATSEVTGEVFCWGTNANGQLGRAAPDNANTRAGKVDSGALVDVLALSAGPTHACALVPGTPQNRVYCWGDATGWGGAVSTVAPVEVGGLAGMDHLAAGGGHTCGWTDAGAMACVGADTAGGGAPALGGPVLQVAAGHFFSCALVNDAPSRSIKCWGQDDKGQRGAGVAGTPTGVPRTIGFPITPPAGLVLTSVAAGTAHACASTDQDGRAAPSFYCWGDNTGHQGGINAPASTIIGPTWIDKVSKPAATASPALPVILEAGGITSCSVKSDGGTTLQCWGGDNVAAGGVFGNGELNDLDTPPGNFSVGADHACIVNQVPGADVGKLMCWGRGSQGQLGNGQFVDSISKVLVQSL